VRLLLVVNAFASSVTARNRVVIHQVLSQNHSVEVVETNRRGHATRFAHDAARRGLDAVVAFGGDGTLNEVATGLAGSDTALAVLPGGSTNVFARTIGLPNDPVAAVRRLVAGFDTREVRRIGLGRVNDRYFCFHLGVGFDAAVVAAVERHAQVKRWAGHPLFVTAALRTWLRDYDRSQPRFSLEVREADAGSEGPCVVPGSMFSIVLNTNPYTYLGNRPLDLSPTATLEQPLVAISFTSLRAGSLLRSLLGALRGGGVRPAEHLVVQTGIRRLQIAHHEPFPYQLDGDHLGDTTALAVTYVPEAVGLVLPPPTT
jgi:diacylglycerol kinase family enzyme